ncbi:MAG: hypothetical protein AAF488_11160 [Planctomycetota bacterium]
MSPDRGETVVAPRLVSTLQEGGNHGGGNQLFVYDVAGNRRVLKVYRRRGGAFGEVIKSISHRVFERKLGVTAGSRCETERRTLQLWNDAGFDVPEFYEDPVPAGTRGEPCLWLEYCPGPSVADVFEDPDVPFDRRRELMVRVAETMGRRHRLAIERDDPLLIPEHASIKHVIVFGDRLVQIDFENGYGDGFDVIEAACQELSGTLRSVARKAEPEFEALVDAFVEAYRHPEQLARIALYGLSGGGTYRGFKRWQDGKRRARFSKTTMFWCTLDRLRTVPGMEDEIARALEECSDDRDRGAPNGA